MKFFTYYKNFGPGILLAATAIGVSHLVQSIQAGAHYGFIMILAIIFAHIVKYPFFEFATRYAHVKQESLLDGYFKTHKFILYFYFILNIIGLIVIQSVVTLVAGAVLANLLKIDLSIQTFSLIIIVSCALFLYTGRYVLLDKAIKLIILALFITTLISAVIALNNYSPPLNDIGKNFSFFNKTDIIFLVAFLGWMPCPLDGSVWNSLWVNKKESHSKVAYKTALADFNIGYFIMAFTAILFLTLGASLLYASDQEVPEKAIPFIKMLFSLYTSTLGQAAFIVVAVTALFTIYSTVISALDAFTRVFAKTTEIVFYQDKPKEFQEQKTYNFFLFLTTLIPLIVLNFFLDNMKSLITLATVTSFLATPIIAYFNYILVNNTDFPKQYKPGKNFNLFAKINIILLILFAILFLISKFY